MRTMSKYHIGTCIHHLMSKPVNTSPVVSQVLLITPNHMLVVLALSASVEQR